MTSATTDMEQRAVDELRGLMREQQLYVKVHAAESLLKFGYPDGVYDEFIKELQASESNPKYHVVVMRVLSRASRTASERDMWANRMRDVVLDPTSEAQLHAIESLAKLEYHVQPADRAAFEKAANSSQPDFAVYARWVLAATDFKGQEGHLVESLGSADPTARYCAAYVFRFAPKVSDATKAALKKAARAEKPGTPAFSYLNSASFVHSTPRDPEEAARCHKELAKLAATDSHDDVREVCAAFATCGTADDLPLMTNLLTHRDPDIREAAANAIISIEQRIYKIKSGAPRSVGSQ